MLATPRDTPLGERDAAKEIGLGAPLSSALRTMGAFGTGAELRRAFLFWRKAKA